MNIDPIPPSSFYYIVEFDRLVDRIAWLLEQRQERELIRRANQSDVSILKLQAGE